MYPVAPVTRTVEGACLSTASSGGVMAAIEVSRVRVAVRFNRAVEEEV